MNYCKQLIFLLFIVASALTVAAQPSTAVDAPTQIATNAQELLARGDAAGAVLLLQPAVVKYPANNTLKFLFGKAFYTLGSYQNAVATLKPIAALLPENTPEETQTVQMLGLGYYVLGQLADAIPFMEKMFARQPDNGEIAYALGVSYIQTRQPAKSREVFAKLFKVLPGTASAYLLNAKMHTRQQFEETAEVELTKALELDPKLPEVRFALGELAVYRAEIDKGVELFKQEIALNPVNGMAYYRLGEAFTRQLKWDDAMPALQKSIWLNPFFSGPYIVLGKVYLKKKDLGNAENLLRRATTIDPNNFGAHYLLAQVLQQLGKADEAKNEFALAEKLRGNADKEP